MISVKKVKESGKLKEHVDIKSNIDNVYIDYVSTILVHYFLLALALYSFKTHVNVNSCIYLPLWLYWCSTVSYCTK